MILLTGVTGLVGRATAEYLLDHGVACRGLARDLQKATDLHSRGMEIVQGDLLDATDVARATKGITSTLLVTPNGSQQQEMERVFAREAASAGIRHLVKISTIRATSDATAPFPRIHHQSEEFIKTLGMRWTMLRGNFFMQNFLMSAQSISKTGTFTLPMGKARLGMIDARDVGEIAARCLLSPGPGPASHDLSGSQVLDCHAVAKCMSVAFSREISYTEQSLADFRAFIEKINPDAWHVDALCALFEVIIHQPLAPVTDDAFELLGRAPRTMESFLHDHSALFAG